MPGGAFVVLIVSFRSEACNLLHDRSAAPCHAPGCLRSQRIANANMRTRAQTRRLSMFPNEDIKVAVLQFLDLEDLKQLSLCNKEWRRRV